MSKDERYDTVRCESHTPGPWSMINGVIYAKKPFAYSDKQREIATMKGGYADTHDVHLIIAAPELLDALKEAYRTIDEMNKKFGCPHCGRADSVELGKNRNYYYCHNQDCLEAGQYDGPE